MRLRYILGLAVMLLLSACSIDVALEDTIPQAEYKLQINWDDTTTKVKAIKGKMTGVPAGSVQHTMKREVAFEAPRTSDGVYETTLLLPASLPASVRLYTDVDKTGYPVTVSDGNEIIIMITK